MSVDWTTISFPIVSPNPGFDDVVSVRARLDGDGLVLDGHPAVHPNVDACDGRGQQHPLPRALKPRELELIRSELKRLPPDAPMPPGPFLEDIDV